MQDEKVYPPLFQSITSEHQPRVARELHDRLLAVYESLDEARDDLRGLEQVVIDSSFGCSPYAYRQT
jgi:hypothetical protein